MPKLRKHKEIQALKHALSSEYGIELRTTNAESLSSSIYSVKRELVKKGYPEYRNIMLRIIDENTLYLIKKNKLEEIEIEDEENRENKHSPL